MECFQKKWYFEIKCKASSIHHRVDINSQYSENEYQKCKNERGRG